MLLQNAKPAGFLIVYALGSVLIAPASLAITTACRLLAYFSSLKILFMVYVGTATRLNL